MTDPSREIPSDEEFGKRVTAAREKRGWKQNHLAARVGCSQPAISAIEKGRGSKFIPDVCRVLKIPGPMWGWSDQQKQWAILGHTLEAYSKASFKFSIANIAAMLEEMEKKGPPPDDDGDGPPPARAPLKAKRPLRAMGGANVSIRHDPRGPDETTPPRPARPKR